MDFQNYYLDTTTTTAGVILCYEKGECVYIYIYPASTFAGVCVCAGRRGVCVCVLKQGVCVCCVREKDFKEEEEERSVGQLF